MTEPTEPSSTADLTEPRPWKLERIGDVVKLSSARAGGRALAVLSCSKVHGIILQSKKFKRRVASKDTCRYRMAEPGMFVYDPMLLWDGSIGRNNYDFPGVVSPAYYVFNTNAALVDPEYLEKLLRSPLMIPRYRQISEGTNTRRRKAKFQDFANLQIPLPPLPEQRAIARVLRTVQEAKEKTEAVIAAAKELKKSLMKHLFTYGPVPVDQADQVKLKETEIGPVPEDWALSELGALGRIGNGSTPKRSNQEYWHEGTFPWLTSGKIHESIIAQADEFVTQTALNECHLPILPAGTILVAITGEGKTLGNAALVTFETTISQHLAYIRLLPHTPEVLPFFILAFLQSSYRHLRDLSRGGGSTKRALTCGLLRSLRVPIPDSKVQKLVEDSLFVVQRKIEAEQDRLQALDQLLKTLLHDLMTARIRVHDLAEAAP